MRKIMLALVLLFATAIVVFASDKVYEIYEADEVKIKDGIVYENATGEKLNGIAKFYYKLGALYSEANYKDGKQSGIEKSYYESGALQSEVNYKDGKKNGITKGYYKSGALDLEITVKKNKAISGKYYKENGKIDRKMTNADFHKHGLEY